MSDIGFKNETHRFRRRAAIAKFKTMNSNEYSASVGETVEETNLSTIGGVNQEKYIRYKQWTAVCWNLRSW